MPIIEIKGNLLETDCPVIAHGVNCQNEMKSGVAKALFTKWPEVKSEYHAYFDFNSWEDTRHFLGDFHVVRVEEDKAVLNCFTQLFFGYDDDRYVSYDAIYDCFKAMSLFYDEIAIPRIGCGLAGGNWNIVKQIISDAVGDSCKVYAYYLED